jgi:hypothetical protein
MTPTLILANVLAPYVAWGVGDDAGLSLPFSMLATTLAALVERPFYKAAGIGRSSLRYSMQANILSWFVGLTIAYVSLMSRLEAIFFLMYFLAIPFSIVIEGGYLSAVSKTTNQPKLKWAPIMVGNIVSGLLLFAIIFVGFESGDRMQRTGSSLVLFLKQNREIIHWSVAVGCVLLFCFCCRPTWQQKHDEQNTDLELKQLLEDAT